MHTFFQIFRNTMKHKPEITQGASHHRQRNSLEPDCHRFSPTITQPLNMFPQTLACDTINSIQSSISVVLMNEPGRRVDCFCRWKSNFVFVSCCSVFKQTKDGTIHFEQQLH